jgi:hypothetical protein
LPNVHQKVLDKVKIGPNINQEIMKILIQQKKGGKKAAESPKKIVEEQTEKEVPDAQLWIPSCCQNRCLSLPILPLNSKPNLGSNFPIFQFSFRTLMYQKLLVSI